jgi:hypothetical protein
VGKWWHEGQCARPATLLAMAEELRPWPRQGCRELHRLRLAQPHCQKARWRWTRGIEERLVGIGFPAAPGHAVATCIPMLHVTLEKVRFVANILNIPM